MLFILLAVCLEKVNIVNCDMIKKHFNNEVVMTEKDNEDFENSTKFGSVIMIILIVLFK